MTMRIPMTMPIPIAKPMTWSMVMIVINSTYLKKGKPAKPS